MIQADPRMIISIFTSIGSPAIYKKGGIIVAYKFAIHIILLQCVWMFYREVGDGAAGVGWSSRYDAGFAVPVLMS